ncbi:MAG: TonB-dependent receptor [Chitinophagaceae bacterium]|nr:TonB-dependent receptor [Chitinophagaceae bacterium]
MRNKLVISATISGLLLLQTGRTQEKETELDPVTVTASIAPEKVSRTGRNLFVIPGERFSKLPVHSIDELLRYLPGIEVQMRGPAGSQSDIVLRGGTFQQVLVIIDGVRVNDANTGHFTSYIPISPAEIEKVEVLKGASSAIYGSEAVGGVIHVITKAFAAKQGKKSASFTAQGTAGQYNLLNVNAGGVLSGEKSVLNAGFLSTNADGQQQRGIKGYFHNKTASASFGYFITPQWHLALRTSWDERDFAAQNFYTTFASDTSTEKVKTSWSQLQVTNLQKNNKLQLDIGYKFLEDKFIFNSASAANLNKSYLLQGLITDEWTINNSSVLTSGIQFINKRISSNDRGKHTVGQAALFAVLNKKLGEYFTVSPGLRLEWNERSGTQLIPQANFSYRKSKWQLRASGGKTIRDADFTERFNNYGRALVTSGRIGNPGLETESSFSYEAGADYFATGNIKISSTFFQRYHKDLIDYVTTPYADMPRKDNLSPSGTYALAKNISKVTTTGLETEIQVSKKINERQNIWSTIGVVWLESKSSSATPSFYISSHARWLANFNIIYSYKWLSVGVNGLYKKRQPQATANPAIATVSADYFLLNVKLEASFWQQRIAAFVQADNILDREYTDILGSRMPGQWLMGGIKLSLYK